MLPFSNYNLVKGINWGKCYKKITALIVCITILFSIVGCGKNKNKARSNSSTEDSSSIKSVESSTPDSSESNSLEPIPNYNTKPTNEELENVIKPFLEALKNKDESKLRDVLSAAGPSHNELISLIKTEFFDKVTVTDYTYYELYAPGYHQTVTLNISESLNPQIKTGKSKWVMQLDRGGVLMFIQQDEFIDQKSFMKHFNLTSYCSLYQTFAEMYPKLFKSGKLNDDDEIYLNAIFLHKDSNNIKYEDNSNLKFNDVNTFIHSTFGFKDFDIRNRFFIKKAPNIFKI